MCVPVPYLSIISQRWGGICICNNSLWTTGARLSYIMKDRAVDVRAAIRPFAQTVIVLYWFSRNIPATAAESLTKVTHTRKIFISVLENIAAIWLRSMHLIQSYILNSDWFLYHMTFISSQVSVVRCLPVLGRGTPCHLTQHAVFLYPKSRMTYMQMSGADIKALIHSIVACYDVIKVSNLYM